LFFSPNILIVIAPNHFRIRNQPKANISFEAGLLLFFNFRFHLIFKSSIVAQVILLQIGVIISRYLSIFWMKNPAAFNDDFWSQLINIWNLMVSTIPQLVIHYLPGPSPLMFHVCSGTAPISDLKIDPAVINYPILIFALLYLMSIIICGGKIFVYKNKTAKDGKLSSKNIFLTSLEKQSLSDFTSSTWGIIGIFTVVFFHFKISGLTPEQFNIYPNYIYVYLIHLVNGPLTCIIIIILCYAKNELLRKVIFREVRQFLGI
jgi:hypothetical protein